MPATADQRPAADRLLRPRSIAIVGISTNPGSLGRIVLGNLQRFAFAGAVHLVHPKRDEIDGVACVRSIDLLPDGVDCAVLAIPAEGVLDAVTACARRGVGGVIIFSAGFAEMGPEGRAVQDRIAAVANDAGMMVAGPNCLGITNYVDGLALTFSVTDPHPLSGPGVAIVSQSGAMAAAIRAALHGRDLDVSLLISTGNEAVNGLEDFLGHVIADPNSRVITIIAEHLRNPRRFLELARQARAAGKPIVLMHPGKSGEAKHAAETHTGAMTGDYDIMRAKVEQAGVIAVDTLEELVDVAEMVCRCRVLPYGGTAVVCESGAFKGMMYDYCAAQGLALPQPEGAAREELGNLAPGVILPTNPIDLTAKPLSDPSLFVRTMTPLLAHPQCGSALISIVLSSPAMARLKMPPILDAMRHFAGDHCLIFAQLGEESPVPQDFIDQTRAAGVPYFRSPERAVRALVALSRWADAQAADTEALDIPTATDGTAARLPAGVIPEYRAKQILAGAGLAMPKGILVQTADDAVSAAETLGYPVVLKAQSAAISHKSDVGGVVLNLATAEAVVAGWQQLHANVAAAAPGAVLDGVLVEAMSTAKGVELIVGARNDPEWGPVVAVGLGGIFAEVLHDVCLLDAGCTAAQVTAALAGLKGAALLGPFRGAPARDVAAVATFVERLGRFVLAHEEIREIDINPLVVLGEGEGVLPLDALIVAAA